MWYLQYHTEVRLTRFGNLHVLSIYLVSQWSTTWCVLLLGQIVQDSCPIVQCMCMMCQRTDMI